MKVSGVGVFFSDLVMAIKIIMAIKVIMAIKIISQNLEFLRHLNLLLVRFDNLDSRCSLQISIMSYIFIIFFKG